ncbi:MULTISPECIES: aminotransferase class V-fold PLP-dependent enzyme [Paracoccus]|jgi:selenocysteine lyase/cysteine desulfurase|uniref:Aminotransferase, class V n=1 Tax=Paracoccus denitrificans (strain Pd 1222) TaxID=318586 RepID=A1B0Y6_PARDP|nr:MULTISPECIES: aminotransferase class V-fold PLP-dependent enzyme [Paracoccus]ABL69180.1 aminotransferase, class V [Paracoccus denitrificans PD1222]MBB4629012.1 selenocysteine lyase/cysteine desulfurase [Paracoccus denitrificans]MCU7430041.1 aminotransferase class V-fold PLP-dependent enzyme [Paracoccus denitrificans]QAR27195.1 aminotransferase class V-fold PLP-dependent enzyme [Paracoccus denitrificans]UPV96164.1 aminotransferase class V-fold PLP-dependent enzyme [Paracoccus denitrificans]
MSYDVAAVRRLFPAVERMTYLDAGFQSPLSVPVKERLEAFIASSFDTAGPKSEWLSGMEAVRGQLAAFVNAAPEEIAFTKNTSEAMNIAANALPLEAGDEVLMLEGDHPNNAYAFLNLARKGVETRFLPMPEVVDGAFFERHLGERTRAISMSLVTFHAGHLFDVESVGRLCRERGLFFVVDVMQGIGVVPVDVKKIGATFVGSGTHKGLLLPQGLGFLYWNRKAVDAQPSYMAAITLENPPADLIARHDNMTVASTARRFEIGNFNLPAVLGLGGALELLDAIGVAEIQEHCHALGDRLIAGLDRLGVGLVGPRARAHRAPHIYVAALPAAEWLPYFAEQNIRLSPERDGVRISLGLFSTEADIDRFLDAVEARLRASAAA